MERSEIVLRDHRAVCGQVATWANRAAEAGRYQDALSWIRALAAVDGPLPGDLRALQRRCSRVVTKRAAAHRAFRGVAYSRLWRP